MRRIKRPTIGAIGAGLAVGSLGLVVGIGPANAAVSDPDAIGTTEGTSQSSTQDSAQSATRNGALDPALGTAREAGPDAARDVAPAQGPAIPITAADGVQGVRLDNSAKSELGVEWEQQVNGYYCGPTATRMALKAKVDGPPNQDDLAGMLGTDQNGTDHIGLVTDVMNNLTGSGYYESKMVDYTPTQEQKNLFRADVKADVDKGYAVVANIWVVAGGPRPDGYPSGDVYHYVTVIGYSDDGSQVLVADPAAGRGGFENVPGKYWIDADKMATLIGGKGYSA